ncbi:MAG: serine protein kinase RIO [Nanoarchaeota archaeon]|nr:serine protein kinase RIO [Nanoarchaeota archaeon]MBU1005931.1 serine protein kinase RIO [Nanoarchaeota archaeon]MBU1946344.1 serine protein kinase RIO [Nanoarchaeota archaeon]
MPHHPKEKFKTMHTVFDAFTNKTLFKLISEGYIEGLESPISMGKEANIFSAKRKDGSRVIVKIYRLENCDFNRMYDYIKEDPRYSSIKGKRRKIIFLWVQREYRNLLKAREANVSVPTPLAFKNNVLILEFIGQGDKIASKLGIDHPKNPKEFFKKTIGNIRKLYKIGLIHADLSQFNILNNDGTPVLIDFSQATVLENSRAEEFLNRDIKNVCNFFRKLGLKIDEEKIIKTIIKN